MAYQKARASIHATPQTSFAYPQANENTRDKWDKEKYDAKNRETGHHYDITRKQLNFVVTSEGIRPLTDITAKELYNRYLKRLEELNFQPSKSKNGIPQNTYIDWVFGGDHDQMCKLAFGNQVVSYDLRDDNSHIRRMKGIEMYAKAVYDFSCKKFGKENVLGVEAHLDETTPHIHVNMIPVAMRKMKGRASYKYTNKKGEEISSAQYRNLSKEKRQEYTKIEELERKGKLAVSYSGLFGENKIERSRYLRDFHTQFYHDVGQYFGLARGNYRETLPVEEQKRIRHKTSVELENETLQRIVVAKRDLSILFSELQDKTREKEKINNEIEFLTIKHKEMSKVVVDDLRREADRVYVQVRRTYFEMKDAVCKTSLSSLGWEAQNTFRNNGYYELDEGGDKVINCALLLAMNLVESAITFSKQNGGGGGGDNMSGWGRKKDEDDVHWWLRCIRQSMAMMKPRLYRGRSR